MQANPSQISNASPSGRLWHWVGSGFWAVADQGLFAGSNFLLNVLLTQWLGPNAYGAFAVGFAVLLFVGAIHVALIGEPMLVFGPGRHKSEARAYLGATLYGHVLLSGTAMLLMLAAGVVWRGELGIALVGFGLGCPCVLLLWMMRRACYMLQAPRAAAAAGLAYLVLMLSGLLAIHHFHRISLWTAIAVMDGSNLVAALALLLVVKPQLVHVGGTFFRNVLAEHFRFGRWGVGTGVLYFLSAQLFYITLAAFDGLNASAGLRALMNLIAPATLVSLACASLLSPRMVTAHEQGRLGRYVRPAATLVVAVAILYWGILTVFAPQIFRLLYRGKYIEYAGLLRLLGASLVATSLIDIVGAALRSREQPREVFLAFAASAVFGSLAGTAMIYLWGIQGAIAAIVGGSFVAAAVLCVFYWRRPI